jgi:2'-5' RNA ligase
MLRLFVALPLAPDLKSRLAGLAGGLPGARWVPEDNLHITLRFAGEVDEPTADAIDQALAGIHQPAFPLTLAGVGLFGQPRGVSTLWVGVERSDALFQLQDRIERAMVRAGLAPERRRFHPHVTLARLKATPATRLEPFLAGNNLLTVRMEADRFTLFSSHLGRGDPVYRPECDYPLGGL